MRRTGCSLSVALGDEPVPLGGSWDPVSSSAHSRWGWACGDAGPAAYPCNAQQFIVCTRPPTAVVVLDGAEYFC